MEPTGPPHPRDPPPDPSRLVPRPRSPGRGAGRALAAAAAAALVLAGAGPAAGTAGPAGPAGPVAATSPAATALASATACLVVGSSRAGRAWLPRARVLVPGVQVLAARSLVPGVRARAGAGLVEVQATSRPRPAPGTAAVTPGVVVLEVVVLDGGGREGPSRRVCTVPAAGPTSGGRAPSAPDAHGVRRLVRAD